MRYQRIFFL